MIEVLTKQFTKATLTKVEQGEKNIRFRLTGAEIEVCCREAELHRDTLNNLSYYKKRKTPVEVSVCLWEDKLVIVPYTEEPQPLEHSEQKIVLQKEFEPDPGV